MPAVLLIHGFTSHRNRRWLPKLAQHLIHYGFVVLRIDLYGHGQSDGQFGNFTYSKAIQDVRAAYQYLVRSPRVNPYAVAGIGYSLGGAAVLLAQHATTRFKSLLLIAAVSDTRWHYMHLPRWKRRYAVLVQRKRRKPAEFLDKHFDLRPSFFSDVKRHDTLQIAKSVHQPVLLIAGSRDQSVPPLEVRRLYRMLHEPKSLKIISGADHLFNRLQDQRTIFHSIKQWLQHYVSNRTSRSVVAVLRHNNRYLIVKRSAQVGYYQGKWGIIGGHLPDRVDPEKHIYHEILEETGIPRSKLKLVKAAGFIRFEHPAIGKTWVSKPFLFESSTAKVKLNWEHTGYRWIKLEKFPFKQSYPGIVKQFKALGLL